MSIIHNDADEYITTVHTTSSPKDTNQGPLTRSHAKKL